MSDYQKKKKPYSIKLPLDANKMLQGCVMGVSLFSKGHQEAIGTITGCDNQCLCGDYGNILKSNHFSMIPQ